ncbi:PKD domain-containing protein [Foetidibacter luteolus]|uniref:PKD domain-containing protein n=1 Tax=Foetidibacter luteolus TaxID=2608880 RepID=UPI00129B7695|nr:PKD domain-containing protein [Foetidibacter luteolus]
MKNLMSFTGRAFRVPALAKALFLLTAVTPFYFSAKAQTSANKAPVAVITGAKTIYLPGNSLVLDGSSSTDSDGSISSYSWKFVSGSGGYALSGTAGSKLTVSNMYAGTRTFQLTVKDDKGASNTAQVTFTVSNEPPNAAPTAVITGNNNIVLPANSTVLSGASSTDADGSVKSYAWSKISGPSAGNASGVSSSALSLSGLVEGTYTYALTVTDDKGATGATQLSVKVNAAPANAIPTASITGNTSLILPANSTVLDGSASKDTDGSIKSYAWSRVSGPAYGSHTGTSTAKLTLSGLVEGIYVYKLVVTDDKGATASASVNVTISAPANNAPVASISGNTNLILPTNSTILDGSASKDTDGSIKSYAWSRVSGPSYGSHTGTSAAKLTLSGLSEGTYVYKLVVTDDKGATATASASVVVSKTSNAVPVAKISGNTDIQLPANSTILDGSGSTDSDGSIKSYAWSYVSGPTSYSFTVNGSDNSKVTISSLTAGDYVFKLAVTDNQGAVSSVTDTIKVAAAPSTGDCGCNITLSANSDGAIYATGTALGVKPGDVVCIKAGNYKVISLTAFNGTATQPVTIKNCGGQVVLNHVTGTSISVYKSSYFRFTGTGSADKYGFKTTTPAPGQYSTLGFKVASNSTDFEIDHVELNRMAVGFMVKTDPTCDAATWAENFTMRNIKIHDTYVHDAQGEGFYCGYTFATSTVTCNGVSKTVYPQFIDGIKIYNNITDSTYWDGIQVGHARNAEIYNNTVTNYGLENEAGQTAGIIFNNGSAGKAFNNTIINGLGPNFQVMGQGKIYLYNNLMVNAGNNVVDQNAIFIDDRPEQGSLPLTVFIANNSIINPSKNGILFMNTRGTVGTDNHIYNNLLVLKNSAYKLIDTKIAYTASNNLVTANSVDAKFAATATADYRPAAGAPTIDAGKDLTSYNITKDIVNVARPQNGKFDIGAYEYAQSAASKVSASAATTFAPAAAQAAAPADKIVAYKQGLTVAPVPARDHINITINDRSTGKVSIKIIDGAGKMALVDNNNTKSDVNFQTRVDVSRFPTGIYYYDILSGANRYTGKFIKAGN